LAQNWESVYGTFHTLFLPSYISFDLVVSVERFFNVEPYLEDVDENSSLFFFNNISSQF
jgi:hypothetical protein